MQTAKAILWQFWRIIRWPIGALALAFFALFLYNLIQYPQRSRDAVAQIHAQKLTMADVDGSKLPPRPNPSLVDATVEGIDANKNGIRDDVELAIFEKYPNDIKTRAAALQYAMTELIFLDSSKVFDKDTWKAAAEIDGRANICVADSSPDFKTSNALSNYIESIVFNTVDRKKAYERVSDFTSSYGSQDGKPCDVEI